MTNSWEVQRALLAQDFLNLRMMGKTPLHMWMVDWWFCSHVWIVIPSQIAKHDEWRRRSSWPNDYFEQGSHPITRHVGGLMNNGQGWQLTLVMVAVVYLICKWTGWGNDEWTLLGLELHHNRRGHHQKMRRSARSPSGRDGCLLRHRAFDEGGWKGFSYSMSNGLGLCMEYWPRLSWGDTNLLSSWAASRVLKS